MATDAKTGILARRVLKPIDISLLSIGVTLEFPLYVRGQGDRRFKLLQGPNLRFSQSVFDRILEDYGGRAYIYPEHVEAYQASATNSLNTTFTDPEKKPEEKVKALMHHVDANLQKALENTDPDHIPEYKQVEAYPNYVSKLLEGETNTRGLILEFLGKNNTLASHCLQVCTYGMMMINRHFSEEYTEEAKQDIGLGFLCHDIGKSQVGQALLNKPGRLSRMEWKVLQQVPERGVSILNQWGITSGHAVDIVRNFREKYDGTGYPKGIKGSAIPKLARICTIVADFSSLTSKQRFRPALSPYDALWIMRIDNEGYYDPHLLKLFVDILTD